MAIDVNKNIIIVGYGDSMVVNRGQDAVPNNSPADVYTPYFGADYPTGVKTMDEYILAQATLSNMGTDFFTAKANPYNSHNHKGSSNYGWEFSFMVDFWAHLQTLSFTKDLVYVQHALDGLSIDQESNDIDLSPLSSVGPFNESKRRLRQLLDHYHGLGEKCEVVFVFSESHDTTITDYQSKVEAVWDEYEKMIGFEPVVLYVPCVPNTSFATRATINAAFDAIVTARTYSFMANDGTAQSVIDQLETDDDEGTIVASNVSTYTNSSDGTHWSTKACILIGKMLATTLANNL